MRAGLARLASLEVLDLSHNAITGTLPRHWDAPRLVELDLHDNGLTGQLPGSLAALPRLSYLQLQARACPPSHARLRIFLVLFCAYPARHNQALNGGKWNFPRLIDNDSDIGSHAWLV